MKMPSVHHESSIKIPWGTLPKSDFGGTMFIGVAPFPPAALYALASRRTKASALAWAARKTVRTRASSRCTIVGTTSSWDRWRWILAGVYLIPRTVAKWKLSHAPSWRPDSAALAGQRQQRVEQRVGAPLDRLPVAHLVGPVAAPAPRGDEEHARGGHQNQVLGVVARPRGHPLVAELELLARRLHRVHDPRRTAGGVGAGHGLDDHLDAAPARDGAGERRALAVEPRQDLGVQLAHLLQQDRLGGHDVGDAGGELDAPDVGHAAAAALADDVLACHQL